MTLLAGMSRYKNIPTLESGDKLTMHWVGPDLHSLHHDLGRSNNTTEIQGQSKIVTSSNQPNKLRDCRRTRGAKVGFKIKWMSEASLFLRV